MQLSSFTAKGYQFKNYTDCTEEENKQILRWRNDEAIRKWMTNDKLIAAEEHSLFVKRLKNDEERAYFAVFCHDQYIASIYLTDIKDERGERGIYVVPDYQGKGVTQHIEIAFLKYIRLKGIRQVIAKVKSDNEKSVRYHIKMGYKEQSRDNEYIHYILDTEMITNVNRGRLSENPDFG